jgi:hypothetical protein
VAVDGSQVPEPKTSAAEWSSGEKLVAVDGNSGPKLRILVADQTSGTMTTAGDGRLGAVPRTSTSAACTSGEVHAADVDSDPDSVYMAHPAVDRSSTGEHETDDVLTAPRHALRTPSAYRASTENGTEAMVPVIEPRRGCTRWQR